MLQKGTGERFKYKEACLKIRNGLVCRAIPTKYFMSYVVFDMNGNQISKVAMTAERAWANTYYTIKN